MSFYSQGLDTLKVPMKMFGDNRKKLIEKFLPVLAPVESGKTDLILLEGGKAEERHDTDHEHVFRQEGFFHYLFGVKEPNFFGLIDVTNRKSYLLIERLPAEYAVWMGRISPAEEFKKEYEVEEVKYVDELDELVSSLNPRAVHVLHGMNTDSKNFHAGASFKGIEKYNVNKDLLFPVLVECRVIKSEDELNLIRYANKVSSRAHMEVMRRVHHGMMEYQAEAIFLYEVYHNGGCRHVSYTCICASGENSAVLHYGHAGAPNSKQLQDGQILMFDMGGEYHCYASDISRSFPVNGKFTEDQKMIYEGVFAAQEAVMNTMKPGVSWPDMHLLSHRVICEHLTKHGLLKGDINEMMENHIGALFMPHGLGHLMGIDTHDCGGYPNGMKRSDSPSLRSLRCGRVLEENMVVTVEPGIYFIPALLDPALADPVKSKFLVAEKIETFRGFGGVRIEDDVIVTKTGMENMTTAPRTVKEIEEWIAGGKASK